MKNLGKAIAVAFTALALQVPAHAATTHQHTKQTTTHAIHRAPAKAQTRHKAAPHHKAAAHKRRHTTQPHHRTTKATHKAG